MAERQPPAPKVRPLVDLDIGISDYLRGLGAIPMADAFDQDFSPVTDKYERLQKMLKGDVPPIEELAMQGLRSKQELEQRRATGMGDVEEDPLAGVAPPAPGGPGQPGLDSARAQQEALRRMLEGGG